MVHFFNFFYPNQKYLKYFCRDNVISTRVKLIDQFLIEIIRLNVEIFFGESRYQINLHFYREKIYLKMSINLKSVLISDPVDESCGALLASYGVPVTTKYRLSKDELIQEIQVLIIDIKYIDFGIKVIDFR